MYLVDTSVWINYMRDYENEVTKRFAEIQESGEPFGITGVIHQEVLQGAASRAKFDYLAEFLGSQLFYHPHHPIESYRGPLACTSIAAGRASQSAPPPTA